MAIDVPGLSALPLPRRWRVHALAWAARALEGGSTAALDAKRRAPGWMAERARRALAPLRLEPPTRARLPIDALPGVERALRAEADDRSLKTPRATVIVPTRGAPSLPQCLAALDAFTAVPHEVLVVYDGVPSRSTVGAARRLELSPRRGFVGAANAGARAANGEVLVFLNDDAVVTPGWLSALLRALDQPRAGLAGPASNDTGDEATEPAEYTDLAGLLAHAAGRDGAPREVRKLSLMCAAVRRRTFEQIGGLDEGYGLGMFEDDELCRQLRRRRLRVLLTPSAFVHHHGSRTFGALDPAERIARFEINRYRFERRAGQRWRAPT